MILKFKKLLVYSAEKCYCANFNDEINIIVGKNTSGKSTLLQSLLYTLGINDVKHNLHELIKEKMIFRLDCEIISKKEVSSISFIRDDSILIVKNRDNQLRFNGINSNNSIEHIKLKQYLSKLFNFELFLESKGELKEAPLETMFLPYYISQAVGWVYLQKSFSNLEYYKNFREDYLDYYLGIINIKDRLGKTELEKKLQHIREKLKFYKNLIEENINLTVSKLANEALLCEAKKYLEEYNIKKKELKKFEREHMMECNELSLLEQRQAVLKKVENNHRKQNPLDGKCPTCDRKFDFSLEHFYVYEQSSNDTKKEKEKYKKLIEKKQSNINSLMKKINIVRIEIEKMYAVINEYQVENINFEQWINIKADIKLNDNIEKEVNISELKKQKIIDDLKNYKTDEEIKQLREEKEKEFKGLFRANMRELGVKKLEDRKYNNLYSITSFPSQGVELHKTVMAYHFAFNIILQGTEKLHRFPFLLDAVFKEDIDKDNRNLIYNFIRQKRPMDTQTIFTVAFSSEEKELIEDMKIKLGGNVKINFIGELSKKRALVYYSHKKYKDLIEETERWITEI